MARKTIELCECDVCGKPAFHFEIAFQDGVLYLDRCNEHDSVIRELRNEKGASFHKKKRHTFRKSTLEEIYEQME